MTKLEETLQNFQNYLLKGDTQVEEDITETQPLNIRERLAIYKNAYYLRLLEILEWDFSILKKYMGSLLFNRLGREYIDAHPSTSYSIIEYGGEGFYHFLQQQSEKDKRLKSIYVELARFEFFLEKAGNPQNSFNLLTEKLAGVHPGDWSKICFVLNPSVVLFESFWNVPKLWQVISDEPERSPKSLSKKNKTKESWLIWGNEGKSFFCTLDPVKRCFWEAIQAGKNFGEVCEALYEVLPEEEIGEFAGSYLNQWIVDRIVVEFHVGN